MPRSRWAPALALAAVAVCAFVLLFSTADLESSSSDGVRRSLAAAAVDQDIAMVKAELALERRNVKWTPRVMAGIVLSILVSLTSTVDRECGAALYMVLFAVLIDLPIRNAMAMTAFTVACGSLAPAIAAMSEPHVTERGVLALVDYPGTLVLLPTMFWGLSMGVILNMAFPSWLLALLWVVFMAGSNVELAWSIYRMFQIRSQLKQYSPQLLHLNWDGAAGVAGHHTHQAAAGRSGATDTAAAGAGDVGTAAAGAADAGAAAHVAVPVKDAAAAAAGPATSGELLQKLKQLRDQAEKVESIALLYPAFYIPSAQQLLDKHNITLEKGNLLGSSMSSKLLLVEQEAVMLQALQEQRSGSSRFTWKWGPWWKLQNHFEMMLVLKVVVLHLVTEGVRHHTTKPCSKRFWMMLFVATGLVTAFLIFIVTAYSRRRLWRGPHWVDALAVVTQQKKSERSRKAGSGASGSAASSAEATMTIQEEDAVVAGPSSRSSSRAGQAAGGEAAAAGAAADKPRGCCGKCKKRLPWVWVTAPEAITNVSACNSRDQYRSWQVPRLLTAAAGAQAVGIFASALGLPAGPTMAYLMLMLGLKPHVVAGSSRFLVLCFCFGVFVAYIIAGNLHRQLALAFGLLNLGLAPLGMLLFRKLNWQTHVLLIMSLVMGTVGMVCIIVWQLVPLLAYLAGTEQHLPYRMANSAVKESIIRSGNTFQLMRFCLGTVY